QRVTLHIGLVEALRKIGYELRNIVIWDRTNIVNRIGIFGWPSNYITMGTTFEYLLDFRPANRIVSNGTTNSISHEGADDRPVQGRAKPRLDQESAPAQLRRDRQHNRRPPRVP